MNRVTRSLAAVAVLAAATVVTNVSPASAFACTDAVCVYEGRDGTGTVAGFTTADNNFSNNRFLNGTNVNDRISSISVHASRNAAMFYTDSYWRGHAHRIENLGHSRPQNAAWDNAFSSFRYVVLD
ncbi:peptidase inhibitor family I36 protein [Herbidospora cretacea]|uniref:peptidase inhibitor family I36 protein n=1 Tax=Herbidospora cretacea TaxID=28444 RepID=UPI0004C32E1C|nr:peptidase inhibitor family I36 protein [Herbidospora cretacea]